MFHVPRHGFVPLYRCHANCLWTPKMTTVDAPCGTLLTLRGNRKMETTETLSEPLLQMHNVASRAMQARSLGVHVDVRFMTNLVNAAAKDRRWVMALHLLQIMRTYGISPNEITFTSILSEMSRAKQVNHAPLIISTYIHDYLHIST